MANEKRLIDANALPVTTLTDGGYWAKDVVYKRDIDDAPTVDAVEVVHGRWVDRYGGKYANHLYECSECKNTALYNVEVDLLGHENIVQALSDYCPNCGAKMDGDGNG